jgi:hypothetical protein
VIERAHEGGPECDDFTSEHITLPTPKAPPKTVAIIACGPTNADWHAGQFTYEPQFPKTDEVWTLNKALRTTRADLVFIMDDMVGEARRSPAYADDIRKLTCPVITSTVDDDVLRLFPNVQLIRYPIEEIIWTMGLRMMRARGIDDQRIKDHPEFVHKHGMEHFYYLHNSVPQILAFALYIGVKGVQLFGADYTFPGVSAREDDRANCEFWVGALRASGVEVKTTSRSTLLNMPKQPWIYGYGQRPPVIGIPTAEWIEEQLCR